MRIFSISSLTILIFIIFIILKLNEYRIYYNIYHIPKIIWTYWHDKEYNPFLLKNFKEWETKLGNLGYTIKILGPDDFPNTTPPTLYKFSHPHQADWIRLYKLKYEGGLWMDASIIINNPEKIESIYQKAVCEKKDLVVFKTKIHETHGKFPIIENWFIMAPINSKFISLWFDEYDNAMRIGFDEYKNKFINVVDTQKVQDLYLTQHRCAQKVLQENLDLLKHILIYDSCESMFKFHILCNWDAECIIDKIKNDKSVPFVKLRGAERNYLDKQLY